MNIDTLISEMTLEEKASLLSGEGFWHTKAVERLGIEPIMVSDGPHGLRKVPDGEEQSIKANCFPTASALACSFDRALLTKLGRAIGLECAAEGVSVILGPGANLKRTPLCGRNFEYFSEDPYLAGEMAASYIKGVQSQGVGTSLKHFACNSQEHRRMSVSAEIDERTFREMYLPAYENAVKNAKPWTVMCSYNKINGEYSSQNKRLLTEILRDEWGYEGLVVSDWGATDDRVKGVLAGLDLEMPGSCGKNDREIVRAAEDGKLSIEAVDKCVRRVLELIDKSSNAKQGVSWDKEADHELAAEIESECAVLLKNDGGLLPLDKNKNIAFIGEFAALPRYQGGGSSHINSQKVTSALQAAKDYCEVSYAKGYTTERDETDASLEAEAIELAGSSDTVVFFGGLPESFEFEGGDRKNLKMPSCQLELIKKLYAANKRLVVVLHNGAPIEMPFAEYVPAVLECYLGGEAVGKAACDLLFGKANPSGKLAETFPKKLSDTPAYLNYPGEGDIVKYREGVFVGYRYYDKKEIEPLFPFGHGLSYTSFEYSGITVSHDELSADETLTVKVTIKNTGSVFGKETVELYVKNPDGAVIRPEKELRGFEKVSLNPGESKVVVFKLSSRAFSYYSPELSDWHIEDGRYEILIGASSRDIRQSAAVYLTSEREIKIPFTLDSLCSDVMSFDFGKRLLRKLLEQDKDFDEKRLISVGELPLHALVSFMPSEYVTRKSLKGLVAELNAELLRSGE